MYDETIKKILNLNDISQVRSHNNYVYNKLKTIVREIYFRGQLKLIF